MNKRDEAAGKKEEDTCNYKGCTVRLAFPPFQVFCQKHEMEIREAIIKSK